MRSYFRKKKIVDLRKQNKVFEGNVADYDATFFLVLKTMKVLGLRLLVTDAKLPKYIIYRPLFNFNSNISLRLFLFFSFCWTSLFWFLFSNVAIATVLESIKMFQTAAGGTFLELFTMMPCVGYLVVVKLYAVEVGARGIIAKSLYYLLKDLDLSGTTISSISERISKAALVDSFQISLGRERSLDSEALAKSSKIKIYKSVFENLMTELREMWPKGQISEEEHQIVSEGLARLKFLVKTYFSCNIILGSIFIMPTVIAYGKRIAGYDEPLILPFFYWLPFDPYQETRYIYQTVLFMQTCHCFLAVLFMLSGDLFFCTFLCQITTQFSLLTIRINKLFYVPLDDQLIAEYPLGVRSKQVDENNSNITPSVDEDLEKKLHQELVFIVHRHQALIRLSNDIENMYTFSLLVNFINSSIIICFCLFCVAVVEKLTEIIYKTFFVTAILQIWILCWYGQRLLDTSTGVADALYNCGWYVASSKVKNSILIMLHRSQNDVHITTFGFSIVSLASYATILKTSWSYFTIMINMYKG